jgi:hypothetical protein
MYNSTCPIMKLNKFTITILSVSIIAFSAGFVLISQNIAYGGLAPGVLQGVSANPASTLALKGTQYAIVVEPGTSGLVKTTIVTFPAGTNVFPTLVKVSIATLNGQPLTGTTTVDNTAKTVTFALDSSVQMDPGDKLFLFIQKVLNPSTPCSPCNLTVETRDVNNIPIDGPTDLPYGIQEVLSPGAIKVDNTIFKVGIGNGVTLDETLTVVGNIKLSGNIVSSGPIKIIPTGDICIGTGC